MSNVYASAAVPSPAASPPDHLAVANVALARHLAGRFRRWAAARGIDPADVESEAMLGLLVGARRYDSSLGVPAGSVLGRSITCAVLALPRKKRCRWGLAQLPADPESGEQMDVADERRQAEVGAAADVEELLHRLDARRRLAVVLHYGLDGGGERTLQEVGVALGVSGKRAHQLVTSALQRLRATAGQAEEGRGLSPVAFGERNAV